MKRFLLIIPLLCAGCATNVGRAFSMAFEGTPKEVVEYVQFSHDKMTRELKMRYTAVEQSYVTNPDGSVNRSAAEARFNEMSRLHTEIERWEDLSRAMAEYLNVDIEEPSDASEKKADERRKELFKAIYSSAQKAIKDQVQ